MTAAKSGDTVKIHYTGTLDDGTQFDSSAGRDPFEFQLGQGSVIPGFDRAVEGMAIGESKTVRLEPDDAYGQRSEQLIQDLPRNVLPDDLTPEVGMGLQGRAQDGSVTNFLITAVRDDAVTVDANHPLAGRPLIFEIELLEIV